MMETGRVVLSEDAAPGVGLLVFHSPEVARDYRPGSFVHLRTGDSATVLRRPFSIARVRGEDVVLLYRIIGSGTEWMRARRPGDELDMMGPLGTVFRLRERASRTLLVGGGLGMAPLLGLAEALRHAGYVGEMEALLGIRSQGDVFGPALTEGVDLEWQLATDDGSGGFHGNAAQLLARRLDALAASGEDPSTIAIYSAGPEPMLEAVARICEPRGLDLQVSMEAHMACGVGACRACGIVPWKDESRIHGRVCKEGPVFDASEILWDQVTI
ncbi:MAG: dihydroorotate dehydrogenase B (NAD(+)), electron transfer subunit [Gemmatimonadota bacterium]|nr:MAG: dihydroorotate dehydrogenase B (NAD(+)), electron transfer subunit [Gemmatimonadota bacterium]